MVRPGGHQDRAPRKPGVVAVARAAGVSPSTVSNAFNRPERLTPKLRERVLRTAAELGYGGPDPAARSCGRVAPARSASSSGGCWPTRSTTSRPREFLKGVSDATDPQQLALVLVPGMPDEVTSDGPAVRNAAVDGLIVFSLPGDDPLIDAVRRRNLPTVFVDSPPGQPTRISWGSTTSAGPRPPCATSRAGPPPSRHPQLRPRRRRAPGADRDRPACARHRHRDEGAP